MMAVLSIRYWSPLGNVLQYSYQSTGVLQAEYWSPLGRVLAPLNEEPVSRMYH